MALLWKHPFTAIISSPTGCGKSSFIKRFLKEKVHSTPFKDIIYCVPEGQTPDKAIPYTLLHEGVLDPTTLTDLKPRLIILDDLMREADSSIVDLFTKGSHHRNLRVIFVTQNIFNQGRGRRVMSLNAHYIVFFKNPRDKQQIRHLGRQVCPENPHFIQEAFLDATKDAFGYLLFDLTQTTPDVYRYRTNIFPSDIPTNIIYTRKTK